MHADVWGGCEDATTSWEQFPLRNTPLSGPLLLGQYIYSTINLWS